MTEIVVNKCYGGFNLSEKMFNEYKKRANITDNDFYYYDIDRADPILVSIVKEMGEESKTKFSELKIITIPDDVEWQIEEYDGIEWVAEKHRMWA